MKKRVLIGCEYSGIVRDAFKSAGHDATSCDILPTSSPGKHLQCDIFEAIQSQAWDILIAFPPCTYLSKAGLHFCHKSHDRRTKRDKAVNFVKDIFNCQIPQIAIENPPGYLTTAWEKWNQVIYPYQHGDPYFKQICLWLKNLPPLLPTEMSSGRKSVSNHVNGRMSQVEKSHIKSKFFPGVAKAMAEQWGKY